MPVLVGCLALMAPRLVLFLVWLFSDLLGQAYASLLWPLLGFVFLPLTTLAYAWAWHLEPVGSVQGFGLFLVIVAALIDVGSFGGAARQTRRS